KWYPEWGRERISNMVATRPDWCISRQRIWGVPILAFYCDNCQEPLTDRKILDRVVKLFAEKTADIWFEKSAKELAGPEARCVKCDGSAFRKENDILDVWFDSGASQLAVLTPENGLPWRSDIYLEGGDQYRGWFHSSLLIGVGLKGSAPYRECAKSGWTLDADGKAMSKSAGNGIEPDEVIKQFGADVLRLWVASVDFADDARLSDEILARLTEAYRKLRNTFRWALGNLADFNPERDSVSPDQMIEFDQWLLVRAEDLVVKCRGWYNELEFHKIYHAVHDFAVTDLSALYFDVAKDRLYTFAPASHARRSAQTALYRVTNALVRLLAPILAYTTEEVWSHFAKPVNAPASIHLANFLEAEEISGNLRPEQRERLANWDRLLVIREEVLKSLEAPRQRGVIGKSLDARIRIQADSDLYPLLNEYKDELPALFIVSQVAVENGNGSPISVDVERAIGEKCERCWKYAPGVGED
ncbi:MAG: class I tRNA ligase family protein, partial [Bryobacteraceae bacterium]